MSMSSLVVLLDPVTDEVTYEFRDEFWPGIITGGSGPYPYTAYAKDYDTQDEHPWVTYTITRTEPGQPLTVLAEMDDGSSVLVENTFTGGASGPYYQTLHSSLQTLRDTEGRTESTTEFQYSWAGRPQAPLFLEQSKVWDAETGRLEYEYTLFLDGRTNAVAYDVTTGQRDYQVDTTPDGQSGRDGRVTAIDYAGETGIIDYLYQTNGDGSSLSQDYDALGRLDYEVRLGADGRMVVTDYDLLDQHSWASYSIAYSTAGQIESVTVL